MRVGIIALQHESNTFIPTPTTLRHFEEDLLLRGEDVRQLADSHHELGGFFAGLAEAGIDAVPILAARAIPSGTITTETFTRLLAMLFEELDRAGSLDGLLVAPHGAAVCETVLDADGYWLSLLRQRFGPDFPIIGTLDPHGNLSPRMVEATNALIAYRTNPHLDQRDRGIEAATLMARTLRGDLRPTQAAAFPPMVINIERQFTSEPQCQLVNTSADFLGVNDHSIAWSLMLGFPYADVPEMGAALIVVTNNNHPPADKCVEGLARYLWHDRGQFVGQFIGVPTAIEAAVASLGPTCLLDMGDNVGGGSPGDGTILAHALHNRRLGSSFVCLFDPDAVQLADWAGVGDTLLMRVGGKTDDRHGTPLEANFTVVSLHDGKFDEPQPRHGGHQSFDQGDTAIVRCDSGLTVMLTSRRMPPFSLRQLTAFGIDPAAFRVIVAKGVHAPVAAYAPVCKRLIRVNTPGVTCADLSQFEYKHRRRPMFPFEPDTAWTPGQ